MSIPSRKHLENYARIFVDFALNNGRGILKGDTVYVVTQLPGIPLAKEIYRRVLQKGGHAMVRIIDDSFQLIEYETAEISQLKWFPEKSQKGLADQIDHWVRVLAYEDPLIFKSVDPKKIMTSNSAARPFREWLDAKEDKGKFTWTLGLYGTEKKAREAGLSEKAYWEQIVKACFLDHSDPIGQWKKVFGKIQATVDRLDELDIRTIHVKARDTDLTVTLGEKRRWLGGSGRNIPSFEIFTSPDWRGTEGKIRFDLPLYRYGQLIKDIRLEFRSGRVVKASAGQNEKFLRDMIAQKNADKIGEFSLTDRRFSRISKFMADSLYDENHGGAHGNMHLAVGKSYHDTYAGKASAMKPSDWKRLGFNEASEHTDIIATTDRTVTATLGNGKKKTIYESGEFKV
jgi:aminopeptidase